MKAGDALSIVLRMEPWDLDWTGHVSFLLCVPCLCQPPHHAPGYWSPSTLKAPGASPRGGFLLFILTWATRKAGLTAERL